jgi:hypothetical protein
MIRPVSSSPPDGGPLGWLHLRDVAVAAANPLLADGGSVDGSVAAAKVAVLEARRRQLAAIVDQTAGAPPDAGTDEAPAPLDRLRARFETGLVLDLTA